MKNLLSIILIFVTNFCFAQETAQEKHKADFQNKWMKTAEENLQKNEINKAFVAFGYVSMMDSLTEKGEIARTKADSLKSVLRARLIKNLIGTWKWKNTGSNWGVSATNKESKKDKILVISDKSLSFYEVNKRTKRRLLIKREKINFNNVQGMFPSFSELIYSDDQIWGYSLKDDGRTLHLTNTGELHKNNTRSEIVCGNTDMIYERIK